MQTIRQGDLLLVAAFPDLDFPAASRLHTLAVGEESGHSHVIEAQLATANGRRYVHLNKPSTLRIEGMPWRHEPITIPPGTWEVRIQREYTPEGIRQVVD